MKGGDGRFKAKDILGKRFGILTVLERTNRQNKSGEYFWKVKCDCGIEKELRSSKLKDGRAGAKSCGCLGIQRSKLTGKNARAWKGYKDISGSQYRRIAEGAMKRDIEFELSMEELWSVYLRQGKRCKYTNIPIHFDEGGYIGRYSGNLSVDRIDSSKGYTLDNVELVYKPVNLMKGSLAKGEFIELCELVAKNANSTTMVKNNDYEDDGN